MGRFPGGSRRCCCPGPHGLFRARRGPIFPNAFSLPGSWSKSSSRTVTGGSTTRSPCTGGSKNCRAAWSPIFYGEGKCEGTRCLVLSEVDGVPAHEQKEPPIGLDEYRRRTAAAIDEMHRLGVSPGGAKMGHTILTPDGRLAFVDLELTYTERYTEYLELEVEKWVRDNDLYLQGEWGIGRPPTPPPPPPGFVYPNNPPFARKAFDLPLDQPPPSGLRPRRGLGATDGGLISRGQRV